MLSLSQASDEVRGFIKIGGVICGVLLLLFLLFKIGGVVKNLFFPDALPNPAFGLLPPIVFPPNQTTTTYTYRINTVTGVLPRAPSVVNVYTVPQPVPSLLAANRAQQNADNAGFSSPGIPLTENVYQWTKGTEPFDKLTMNIFTGDFTLTSDYLSSPSYISGENLRGEEGAITAVDNLLSNLSNYPEDIDPENTKTTLLSVSGTDLVNTTSLSNTQIIRVDLFQKDVDGIAVVYPNPPYSTMNFYVGSGGSFPTVVKGDFLHYEISSPSAMYPIKTTDEAFAELQKNKAYIPTLPPNASAIGITDVALGYYVGEERQQYVQPVYIFTDGEAFRAYVPAVQNSWIKQ